MKKDLANYKKPEWRIWLRLLPLGFGQALTPAFRPSGLYVQTKTFSAALFYLVTIFLGPCLGFQSHPNVVPIAGVLRQT